MVGGVLGSSSPERRTCRTRHVLWLCPWDREQRRGLLGLQGLRLAGGGLCRLYLRVKMGWDAMGGWKLVGP